MVYFANKTMSIVRQIEGVEANISSCENRLDEIEKILRLTDTSFEYEKELKNEEKKLNLLLKEHKSELSTLRRENRKNMLLAVIVLAFCAVVYMFFKTE